MRGCKFRAFTVLVACTGVLWGCNDEMPSDARTNIPLVRTELIQPAPIPERSFTGVIAAKVQSDIGFRVSGKIKERLVDVGQQIRKGQVLFRLDPIDLQLNARAQQKAVLAAKALAKQATDEEKRLRKLVGTGAVSQSAYDQALAAKDSAQAQLKAAEAQAAVAQNTSLYTELVADHDGVVLDVTADTAQVVSAGQIVVSVAHTGPREALIQLPETVRPQLGSTATASLFGYEQTKSIATLRQLSETADKMTRTFEARYVLDSQLETAPLGATVTISLSSGERDRVQTFKIPTSALYDRGKGAGIWVVSGAPETVKWRAVEIKMLDNEHAFVSGSLSPEDRIVTLGVHLLRENDLVRLDTKPTPSQQVGAAL